MEKSPQERCQILLNQVSALNKVQLLQTCQHLELPELLWKIQGHLLREELEEQEHEGMAFYVKLANSCMA